MSVQWNVKHQGPWIVFWVLLCLMPQWASADSSFMGVGPDDDDRFKAVSAAPEVKRLVARILSTQNHQSLPFVVLDKKHPEVFVFDAKGHLKGAAPALIGLAVGDDAAPGIGSRLLSSIQMAEKTTPAGRFVASLDLNLSGNQILWVDYDAAISMHPVVTHDIKEHRAERLASKSTEDNRISYGCINVSARFFQKVVMPAFQGTYGIVYILPDSHAIQDVFLFYEP